MTKRLVALDDLDDLDKDRRVPYFKVKIRVHNLLQEFILKGGFDL